MQETGSDSASLLTGLGLDEYLSRTDTSGAMSFLTDGLGSTIALTNSSGTTTSQYDYEPFGFPTSSGSANSNPYQFTGREYNPDVAAAGLYYLRGRYYSSRLQRFLQRDPLGLAGGDVNLYRYVGNDPVDFTDPTGLSGSGSGGGGGGGSFGSLEDYLNQDTSNNGCGVDCGGPPGGGGGGGQSLEITSSGFNIGIQTLTLSAPRFAQGSQQGMQKPPEAHPKPPISDPNDLLELLRRYLKSRPPNTPMEILPRDYPPGTPDPGQDVEPMPNPYNGQIFQAPPQFISR